MDNPKITVRELVKEILNAKLKIDLLKSRIYKKVKRDTKDKSELQSIITVKNLRVLNPEKFKSKTVFSFF